MALTGAGPRLADEKLRGLKVATRVLLSAFAKDVVAAGACRLNPGSLSDCASAHHPERTLPIDVALQLELMGESRAVTEAMALAHGCLVVPVEIRGGGDLARELSALGQEVGDVFSAAPRALADGKLTAEETGELKRELSEMIAAGQRAIAALMGVA